MCDEYYRASGVRIVCVGGHYDYKATRVGILEFDVNTLASDSWQPTVTGSQPNGLRV